MSHFYANWSILTWIVVIVSIVVGLVKASKWRRTNRFKSFFDSFVLPGGAIVVVSVCLGEWIGLMGNVSDTFTDFLSLHGLIRWIVESGLLLFAFGLFGVIFIRIKSLVLKGLKYEKQQAGKIRSYINSEGDCYAGCGKRERPVYYTNRRRRENSSLILRIFAE